MSYINSNAFAPILEHSGLQVAVNSGLAVLTSGAEVVIAPTLVTLPANATSYLFLDTSVGAISHSAVGFPTSDCYPVGIVTTNSIGIASLTDVRPDVIASGGGVLLETNGEVNTDQEKLNLFSSDNSITVTNDSSGNTNLQSGLPVGSPEIVPAGITSWNVFGDSIASGLGVAIQQQVWANMIAQAFGLTGVSNNFGVPSATMGDNGFCGSAYPLTTSASVGSFAIPGANEVAGCTSDPTNNIPIYINAVRAFSVWLGLLPSQKVTTTGLALTGSWSNGSAFNVPAVFSSTNGDTAKTTVTGTTVYVGMVLSSSSASSFSVSIDGIPVGSYSGTNPFDTFYPLCLRFAGLSNGSHLVSVSPTSGAFAIIQWIAGNGGSSSLPLVSLGNTLPQLHADASVISQMNSALATEVANLRADGLELTPLVDVNSAVSITSIPPQFVSDGVHPNSLGNELMTAQWLKTLYVSNAAAGLTAQNVTSLMKAYLNAPPSAISAGVVGSCLTAYDAASGLFTPATPGSLVSAPATATSTGTAGQVAFDSSFFYVCTATNTWKRVAVSAF